MMNSKKYWLRGLYIALIIWMILVIFWFILSSFREGPYAKYEVLLDVIERILYPISIGNFGTPHGITLSVFVYPLLEWIIGGVLLGWIYGKIRNKNVG